MIERHHVEAGGHGMIADRGKTGAAGAAGAFDDHSACRVDPGTRRTQGLVEFVVVVDIVASSREQ